MKMFNELNLEEKIDYLLKEKYKTDSAPTILSMSVTKYRNLIKNQLINEISKNNDLKIEKKIEILRQINTPIKIICASLNIDKPTYYRTKRNKYREENKSKELNAQAKYRENLRNGPYYALINKLNKFKYQNGKAEIEYGHLAVIAKYGKNPVCFFTGEKIDYNDISTFDFIKIDKTKDCSLSNIELVCPGVAALMNSMDSLEFKEFIARIARHIGLIKEDIADFVPENKTEPPNNSDDDVDF